MNDNHIADERNPIYQVKLKHADEWLDIPKAEWDLRGDDRFHDRRIVYAAPIAPRADAEKDAALEQAANICEAWARSIDTGEKRNRVVSAAMQGALTCADEIRAILAANKESGK